MGQKRKQISTCKSFGKEYCGWERNHDSCSRCGWNEDVKKKRLEARFSRREIRKLESIPIGCENDAFNN